MICQRCAKDKDDIHTCIPSPLVRDLEQQITEALADVTHWNETFIEARAGYEEKLAAEQTYAQQLREALNDAQNPTGLERERIERRVKALALPQDDTALKQYGAKLLRDAAGAACGIDAAMLSRMAYELEGK